MKEVADYMFVCEKGFNRSPVAAKLFLRMAMDNGLEITVGKIGLNIEDSEEGDLDVSRILNGAKLVFTMDKDLVRKATRSPYNVPPERIINLNIPDDYSIYEAAQVRMLEEVLKPKFKPYIDEIQ
ncbi:hypothetical protein HN747_00630 [archaeon]|jgi:predicted protein tyrosine phosphatase|nr:hypothetical protein [archaeon]